ncbi:hypothetical protein BU26DRAFT_467551 [Trematosphaeria pertusa]|uniref:Uncharacterized protein n=1 Tax=Trematosphaeria pertusa TaxID=390896 RepID=A0A6A6HX93_9PLEO|nr:uncharacterized protein BU26DRAFT_467551 [Trematosphaeria pertusa]KAF2242342.1 hypothetical protein BU26DRAFT_467551 [Trematosphaeria pertusa]
MGRKSEERYIYEGGLLQLRGPSPTRSTHREPSPTRSTHSEVTISSSSETPKKKSKLRRGLSKLLPNQKKPKTETSDLQNSSPALSPVLPATPKVALVPPPSSPSIPTAPKVDPELRAPSPIVSPENIVTEPDILPLKLSPSPSKMSSSPAAVRYDEAQAQGGRRSSGAAPGPNSVLHKEAGQLIKGAVNENGELKDAALLLGIKLDLEAEIHLTARVRGDITIGLY